MLAFERSGTGAPSLVFVHGFGCAREDWRDQVEHFSGEHDCVAVDLPGFGQSHPLTSDISMSTFADAIREVMDSEGIEQAVLFGHSMGCRPIVELSISAPDRVAGLVLVDPGRASVNYEASKAQFEALIGERGFPNHAHAMFANMFFDLKYDALRDRLAGRGAAVPADVAVATYLAMLDWDANRCEAAFDAVSVPVMVLQSTTRDPGKDRRPLKPGEMAPYQKMIMERIEGAQTESFPGVGHFTMIEAADAVCARIQTFIDERADG
jgi:pimeloyl-ACP methyl ester carboxylesterase